MKHISFFCACREQQIFLLIIYKPFMSQNFQALNG